jgi:hypothetical protein
MKNIQKIRCTVLFPSDFRHGDKRTWWNAWTPRTPLWKPPVYTSCRNGKWDTPCYIKYLHWVSQRYEHTLFRIRCDIGYALHNGRSAEHRACHRSHRNEVNKHSIGEDACTQVDGCDYMCCWRWLTVRASYALSETALPFGNWQLQWLVVWHKGNVTRRWVGGRMGGAILTGELNGTERNWTVLMPGW